MTTAGIFLLPNATCFVELAVCLILVFVLAQYVLPVLNKAVTDRQEQIRSSMEAAERARTDAAAADDERRAALETARQQAREIVATANRTAAQVLADSQTTARTEYERIVDSADAEVQLARQRAVDEAATRLGELVLEVVERVIGREIDAEAHRDLIDVAVTALNAEGRGGAAAAGAETRP